MTDLFGQLYRGMARAIPDRRLDDLLRAATEVFIAQGYRRTQMADVAQAMGLAKGTLYLYVESKEALFDFALRNADREGVLERPPKLPIPTPSPAATLEYVANALAEGQALPRLQKALSRRRVADIRGELDAILRELYRVLLRYRRGLKLVDRCAHDHPELAALWFRGGRGALLDLLVAYLERRGRLLRPLVDRPVAARIAIETLVFWAVHRHWDPAPQAVDDRTAEDAVVRFLIDALAKEKPK